MKNTIQQYLLYGCKAPVGIIFCISAILKLLSIESFEIYIYSFQFFSLNFSYLVARVVICIELMLGIALILNLIKNYAYICSLFILIAFTFFLTYTHFIIDNQENCHCFGDIIELNPIPSIIKNILFIVLLVISKNTAPFHIRHNKIVSIILFTCIFLAIFIISPPDNWLSQKNADLNETALNEAFAINVLDRNDFDTGEKIICFYGVGCKYCKFTAKKLAIIQEKHPDLKMDFIGVFWGSEKKYNDFIKESDVNYTKTYLIDPAIFLKITNGKMPIVLIMKDGTITDRLKYRDIEEKLFVKRLSD